MTAPLPCTHGVDAAPVAEPAGAAAPRPVVASQPGPGGAAEPPPVVERRALGWHARLELPLLSTACTTSRRTARSLLRAWEVPDDEASADALLVVSELVGNAVRHGGQRVALELELRGSRLVVAVCDDADGLPQPRGADEDEEGGRGLAIVTAITEAWGYEETEDGKRVWARLALRAA